MKILKIGFGVVLLLCLFLFFSLMYNDDNKNLGSGFIYNTERKDILGKIDIPPTIILYKSDKQFIIVKQQPTEFHNSIYDKMEYVYPKGRKSLYFWIIEKNEQNIIGPLDSLDFVKELEQRRINLRFSE